MGNITRSVSAGIVFLFLPLHASFDWGSALAQDKEASAKRPGLVVKEGVAGTEEGHAIGELQYWISWGDDDLAEAAYRVGLRDLNSPNVRFVRSWALLRRAVATKKGYTRALAALDEIDPPDAVFREHVAALVKSVRAVMPCIRCDGKGRLRCVACHGSGAECDRCENGNLKCPGCEGPRAAPALDAICTASPCRPCEGRGLLPKTVRLPCEECRGLGQKLAPKADPQKKLP